ncbi:MAG: DMT family transporter [Rhizobiaceae bacterium]|nr:DMT family transporter [Rhizobiaceae bacterium]
MTQPGKPTTQRQNIQFATGRQKWLGHLAMLTFSILIAGSFSIGYQAAPHIAPAALNAIRFALATMFMGVTVFVLLKRAPRFSRELWLVLILGALMATYFILMFVALQITNPVSTGAVFTLIPFMSAVFGWLFLGMVSRPSLITSLLIAASGSIWMIFRGDINSLLAFDIGRGELIFLVGCACHAAYAPLVKKFNQGIPVIEFTFWTLAATTFWILLYGANDIVNTRWSELPQIVWWAIAYLSVFTTAVTFFLVQFASMRLHASKVMSYGYLTPGVIILIEGVIGNGWATLSVGLGAVVTIIGLVFLVLSPDS